MAHREAPPDPGHATAHEGGRMILSEFSIKRPIVTVVTMLAFVIFGLFALARLKVDEFPDVQQPIVAVSVVYPGASPEGVEREILDPVEEAISGISGVDKMQSTAQDGFAQIIVFFTFDKDVQVASQEIRDQISTIRGDLPQEMEEPILSRFDPDQFPILSVVVSSDTLDAPSVTRLVDPGVTKELRGIPGVAQVKVIGGIERELTVELRPDALQAAGVSVAEVVGALAAQNLAAPVGRVNGPLEERTIRLRGRLERPEDFAQLVVARRGDRVIRLGDLGVARDATEEPRSIALLEGRQAVGLDILKSKGYSTADVAARAKARLAEIATSLPKGLKVDIVRDAGQRVEDSVHEVELALVEGALLTVLVVFLFLNSWRSTVITGLALPVSVLASFVAVWAFGFTLNTMSLLGLSLAIGILIDDAIVVRENIVRHVHMGKDHYTAAREGTAEIGLAVAATTFSIVAVFVPVAFMSGVAGQWFKPFALTIASSVLVSLYVSFSLDPMLSAYWPDPETEAGQHRNPISRALERFNLWFDRQAERYKRLVGWALDHRVATIAIATLSFFGAIFLQATVGGSAFMPISDDSELQVTLETPPGSSIEYTRERAEDAARLARALPEVIHTYTTVGGESGAVDTGGVYIKLKRKADRERRAEVLAQLLRDQLATHVGAKYSVFANTWGGGYKQIQLELRGPDSGELARLAEVMRAEVEKVPGAVDVGLSTRGQKPELEITLDRGLAGALGITVGQAAQSLYPAFAGIDAGDWVDPQGETRDVTVRFSPEARRHPTDLAQLPLVVPGADGTTSVVPLGQIATIQQGLGPAAINHLDTDRVVNIQANASGRPLSDVLGEINKRLAKVPLPAGYRLTQGGEAKDQAEVFGQIFASLGIAVLFMYLILVLQFGSFLDPIAIMLSLPLSLIGVVLALILTHDTLNLMSLIGVILLMGIVAKNAILLIDFAKWGREQGMSRRDAIIEAGRIRLRPILMTTFALIAGMIPVALGLGEGADFRAPLGRAVIGGTLTATLLTLLVIPTVYEILDEWRERLIGFVRGRRAVREEIGGEPALGER